MFGAPMLARLPERQSATLDTELTLMRHVAISSIFVTPLFTAGAASAAPHIGQLMLSDYQASATQIGPNTWHYDGTLRIPVAFGEGDVPGASRDMTFNTQ